MKTPKPDTSGTEEAQRAIAEAQAAANNLKTNFQADLGNDNVASVVAGGGADATAISPDLKRRRSQSGGLSSQLGITA